MNGDPRVLYSVMVTTRMNITRGCGYAIMKSLIIAGRYAVCRRQFKTTPGSKKERKLIDYQTHLQLIGNNMANAYVLLMTREILY